VLLVGGARYDGVDACVVDVSDACLLGIMLQYALRVCLRVKCQRMGVSVHVGCRRSVDFCMR
jgi:hypothetical protein